jgi:hypothetical protein
MKEIDWKNFDYRALLTKFGAGHIFRQEKKHGGKEKAGGHEHGRVPEVNAGGAKGQEKGEAGTGQGSDQKYEKIKEVLNRLWDENEAIGKRDGLTEKQIEATFFDAAGKAVGGDERIQPYYEKWV